MILKAVVLVGGPVFMKLRFAWVTIILSVYGLVACSKTSSSPSSGGGGSEVKDSKKIELPPTCTDNTSNCIDINQPTSPPTYLLPGALTVVTASNANSLQLPGGQSLALTDTVETDFSLDRATAMIRESSLETFDMVSNYLCLLAASNYHTQIDKGAFNASVDADLCLRRGQSARTDAAGNEEANLAHGVVIADKLSDTEGVRVRAWFSAVVDKPGSTDTETVSIQLQADITEGVTTSRPLGSFNLSWAIRSSAQSALMEYGIAKAMPSAGSATIVQANWRNLWDASNRLENNAAASLNFDELGRLVNGLARSQAFGIDSSGTPKTVWVPGVHDRTIAFNESFFQTRQGTTLDLCRSRNEVKTNIFKYGLYNSSNGSRVNKLFGMPIETATGVKGWASGSGISLQNGQSLASGATLKSGKDQFTLLSGPGKLFRYTRRNLPPSEIMNRDIVFRNNSVDYFGQLSETPPTGSGTTGKSYKFTYTKTSSNFGSTWTQSTGEIPLVDTQWGKNYQFISPKFRGDITAYFKNNQLLEVFFFNVDQNISALSSSTQLYCYNNCPKAPIAKVGTNNVINATDVFYPQVSAQVITDNIFKTYRFNQTDLTLFATNAGSDIASATFAPGTTPSDLAPAIKDGIFAGPFITSDDYNQLKSDNEQPWRINSANTLYSWQTGLNHFNRLGQLKRADGTVVQFDPLLFFDYVHTQANDRDGAASSSYYNQTFKLNFAGTKFAGIPMISDHNEFKNTDAFALADGTKLGMNSEYMVKAMVYEQRMAAKDSSSCAGLSFDSPNRPTPTRAPQSPLDLGLAPTVE
jgi:hypothetical protein